MHIFSILDIIVRLESSGPFCRLCSYLKVRNGFLQEFRPRLKICIEYRHELVIFHIITAHCGLEISRFIARAQQTVPIQYPNTALLPFLYFCLDKILHIHVVGIIKNLHEHSLSRPVHNTDRSNGLLVNLFGNRPNIVSRTLIRVTLYYVTPHNNKFRLTTTGREKSM